MPAMLRFGHSTSISQAPIGALAGTALARGPQVIWQKSIPDILRRWPIGPVAGLVIASCLACS